MREPSPTPNSEEERKHDVNSENRLSLHTATTTTAGSHLAAMTDMQHTMLLVTGDQVSPASSPMNCRLSPSLLIRHSAMLGGASLKAPFELARSIEAADVSLAVGLYKYAYEIYSDRLGTVWANYRDCAALPFTVSMITNMSRAASSAAELVECKSMMEQLLFEHTIRVYNCKIHDEQALLLLHTSLAVLLSRLQQPSDATRHYQHASWILKNFMDTASAVSKDLRLSENLLYECASHSPLGSYYFYGMDWWGRVHQFQHDASGALRAGFPHDETLRSLFAWCASTLAMNEFHVDLVDGLRVAAGQNLNSETMIRALSVCLFRHFWGILSTESDSVSQQTGVIHWVEEICKKMQVSGPDLFAAIALALTNLLTPLRDACKQVDDKGTETPARSAKNAIELPGQMREAALAFASEQRPHSELVRAFLTAHSTINLTRVTNQLVPGDSLRSLVEEVLPAPVGPPQQGTQGPIKIILQTGSDDPPLSPTPRSSVSSLRSMLSLRRRIDWMGEGNGTDNERLSGRMSTQSSESWSLRHQLYLSGISYRTSSSVDARSMRGSAMDWEPAVSGIKEGVTA